MSQNQITLQLICELLSIDQTINCVASLIVNWQVYVCKTLDRCQFPSVHLQLPFPMALQVEGLGPSDAPEKGLRLILFSNLFDLVAQTFAAHWF